MRRMDEENLNDEQIEQLDDLENAVRELLSVMSEGQYEDPEMEDIYDLLEKSQEILEKRNIRVYFPAHIEDTQGRSYTIDYTDEEIDERKKSLDADQKKPKGKGR